jgi:hypothetical protein
VRALLLFVGAGLLIGGRCENLAPSKPLALGPVQTWSDTAIEFRFQSTDPEGDQVEYWIEWGDGSAGDWSQPREPGVWYIVRHSFADTGGYSVLARARDLGLESDWSDSHRVAVAEFGPFVPPRPVRLGRDTVPVRDTVGWRARAGHPLKEEVSLQFDWGDTVGGWSGPYEPGNWVTLRHIYGRAGMFLARVRARDRREHVTDWSAPGTVWVVDSFVHPGAAK